MVSAYVKCYMPKRAKKNYTMIVKLGWDELGFKFSFASLEYGLLLLMRHLAF
jgi:hypothetical protein